MWTHGLRYLSITFSHGYIFHDVGSFVIFKEHVQRWTKQQIRNNIMA